MAYQESKLSSNSVNFSLSLVDLNNLESELCKVRIKIWDKHVFQWLARQCQEYLGSRLLLDFKYPYTMIRYPKSKSVLDFN